MSDQPLEIVDTHLHLIYLDRFSYPWLDAAPALKKNFSIETYRGEAVRLGINATIHMEVDVAEGDMEKETAFVTSLDLAGAVVPCRPEAADFPAYVERQTANRRILGFRRVLHTQPDDLAAAPVFAENLRYLAVKGYTFDLCVLPRQIPLAIKLAKACPGVQFVLDHCGVPNVKDHALDPWRRDISAIAELPNVAAKISGIIAYGDPERWTVADLKPFFEHTVESFGFDRLVWGSDWPVCTLTGDLTRWVEVTHTLLSGYSRSEKERLLAKNARRIYRCT